MKKIISLNPDQYKEVSLTEALSLYVDYIYDYKKYIETSHKFGKTVIHALPKTLPEFLETEI